MSARNLACHEVRLAIGAEPQSLSGDVAAHLPTCAACSRFRDETLMLDGQLRAALELPLAEFRRPAVRPVRRYALAASLMLGLMIAGAMWIVLPQPALAGEVVEHVLHEPGSWDGGEVSAGDVAAVLGAAGVEFDSTLPIVYAAPCSFRGRRIAHLVVQTATGPMTVMLLPHETVARRREFSEDGMRGVLLPAGAGAVAVLARDGDGDVPAPLAEEIVRAVRW
jgi:hypothetical protein